MRKYFAKKKKVCNLVFDIFFSNLYLQDFVHQQNNRIFFFHGQQLLVSELLAVTRSSSGPALGDQNLKTLAGQTLREKGTSAEIFFWKKIKELKKYWNFFFLRNIHYFFPFSIFRFFFSGKKIVFVRKYFG